MFPYQSTQVARATPFDNANNQFVSLNTQEAIEEVRFFINTPATDQCYYVTKQGSDTTGNGSFGKPYLTISAAMAAITDSSVSKRYVIHVGPGDYNENIVLKANVFIKGSGSNATRLTGATLNINQATWNTVADHRSGLQDLTINNVCSFLFTAQTNNTDGKLFFFNIRALGAWTVTARGANNQLSIQDSQFFAAYTQNGTNAYITGTSWQSGAISLNSSTVASIPATLVINGGRTTGNITATWTSNSAVTLTLAGFNCGVSTVLTASGASCTVNVNDGSLPVPANRSFVSGATLNRLNDNFARGLLSATTNVDVAAAVAPIVGQSLMATSGTSAMWAYPGGISVNDFGDGSDGSVTINSGTTVLARTMYYDNLTVSGTGVLNTNGHKIYVRGTLAISGSGSIVRVASNGNNGSGGSAGGGAGGLANVDMGGSGGGAGGGAGGSGLAGSSGNPGGSVGAYTGYGSGGGNGGEAGSGGPGGTTAAFTFVPERIVRHDHIYMLNYKQGGQGGAGGGGGSCPPLGQGGGGGGGGAGGGVIMIFAANFNNTSSIGVVCRGGNGGNGGNATVGNSRGGGGGGGGGGGHIYLVTVAVTNLGTLNVSGGNGGNGGNGNGSGGAGSPGQNGDPGRTTVYQGATQTFAVT